MNTEDPHAVMDSAMGKYYRALGHYDFCNEEGVGKFMEFCEDNGLDGDDIEDELADAEGCIYMDFDEDDFPFNDEEQELDEQKQRDIKFEIIRVCYTTHLPPDKYRPRQKNLTHPLQTTPLVDAYLRNVARTCIGADGHPVICPKSIRILCTRFELTRYNYMAPYDIVLDLPDNYLKDGEKIYSSVSKFMSKTGFNYEYDWLALAIGYYNRCFPWILYVVETYDRDRIRRGCYPEKKELSFKEWMKECDFIQEYLLEEENRTHIIDSIEKVTTFYIRKWKNQFRVLPSNLEMERMYIKDDLYEFTEVVLGIYRFVKELYATYPNGTKFTCEFAIAVRSTDKEILTVQVRAVMSDDDEPPPEEVWIHNDELCDFPRNMRSNQIPHVHKVVHDRSKIHEVLHAAYKPFSHKVNRRDYKDRKGLIIEAKTEEEKSIYYNPFPKRRRFCCFVDRRAYYNEPSWRKQMRMMGPEGMMMRGGRGRMHGMMGMMDMMGMGLYEWVRTDHPIKRDPDKDEICFFIPADSYLPTEKDAKHGIYPESYFEINHHSMIPECRVYDKKGEAQHLVSERYTGISSVKGSLFNLQFHCERYDEIRMYAHWNNQNIRLFAEDFWKVLPRIFVKDYARNEEFAKDLKIREKIKANLEQSDKYFEYFYNYLSIYGQPKKDWIDKPTGDTYVN